MNKLLSGRRLLVVEDETLVLLMIEDMLTDLGCESIATAATVEKALALVDAQFFDAAMLDMNLSGKTSHPVAEALIARGVPFVYSTGNTDRRAGNNQHEPPLLRKPFTFEELVETFTRLFSR